VLNLLVAMLATHLVLLAGTFGLDELMSDRD
jgi:hypothetical protein